MIPREDSEYRVAGTLTDGSGYKLVLPGDFVISLASFEGGIEYSPYRGIVSPAYSVLKARPAVSAGYFRHLLKSQPVISALRAASHGIRQGKTVSVASFGEIRIPVPASSEQEAIAEYLDVETSRLDQLIDRKLRSIDLLREKRAAVVAQAVTQGLDDVELVNAPVEWLDRYPATWRLQPLKHFGPKMTVGIVVTPAKYYVDEGVPALRSFNISTGSVVTRDIVFISDEGNRINSKSVLHEDDIVIVRTGKTGVAAIVPGELDGANCIDLLIVRRCAQLDPRYLWYFLNSSIAAEQVALHSVGSIQAHYNTGMLANMLVTAPDVEEQRRVVRHLDSETRKLDSLMDKIGCSIDLLREYRTALISAAVTGQIDIPGTETSEEVA